MKKDFRRQKMSAKNEIRSLPDQPLNQGTHVQSIEGLFRAFGIGGKSFE